MRLRYSFTMLALVAATDAVAQQSQRPCMTTTPTGYFVLYGVHQVDSLTTWCNQPVASSKRTPPAAGDDDPLAAYLFPPELIMAHQSELGLQDAQRTTMTTEIQKAQARFVELQWKMSAETERLRTLLEPAVADEAQVLEQIDRTLAVEREIKRIQVALLVRIKNTLTPSQQAKLAEWRDNRPVDSP